MKNIVRLSLLVIAISLFLSGCSRQSTTDFTPYPSNQAAVRLALAPAEKEVILSTGVELSLNEVQIGFQTITPTDDFAGAVSPSVRTHTHEEEESTEETTQPIHDPNVEPGDARSLVPILFTINTAVSLLDTQTFGTAALRAGAAVGWKVNCVPVAIGDNQLSVYVRATAKHNGKERSIRVLITDPFEVVFPSRSVPAAGMTDVVGLHFHVGEWFENLGLENLVAAGGGEILIEEQNEALHEQLLSNLKKSTAYEGVNP